MVTTKLLANKEVY